MSAFLTGWLLSRPARQRPVDTDSTASLPAAHTTCALPPCVSSQSVFTWAGFSSTTKNAGVMSLFLGKAGERTMYQLQLKTRDTPQSDPTPLCSATRRGAA